MTKAERAQWKYKKGNAHQPKSTGHPSERMARGHAKGLKIERYYSWAHLDGSKAL